MSKILKFTALLLYFSSVPLSAQNSDTIYVIREVNFEVEGRSRPFALISYGEFQEGERIIGEENLYRYIAIRRQLLLNQRVLEDVWIEFSLGEREEDGAVPVALLVHVIDTRNLIALPYPRYDSNDGFSITLKARDYNFLGTMRPLRFDLGYRHLAGENALDFSIESTTPFEALGFLWAFRFDHFFSYTFGDTLYYQNVSGIAMDLPQGSTTFTFGLNQYVTVNEENSDEDREIFGLGSRYYGTYGSTELFASWEIPLGFEVGDFGRVSYTPSLSERINYPYSQMSDTRKPVTTFRHELGFGRVDWIGNYRRGLSASAGNSFNYYIDRPDAPLRIGLDGRVIFHMPLTEYIGFSSRLNYRQWWHRSERNEGNIPYYYAGDRLRGVINNHLRAESMLSLNLDIPVRALRFTPSMWLERPSFRIFDFEMHLSPFTDLALIKGPYNRIKNDLEPAMEETRFSLDDMIYTTGFDIIIFPAFFRSMYLRVSLGYNINKIRKDGFPPPILGFIPRWEEIFIGLEHHY
ncbi:MAG: hypothetical protein FWG77_07035 [Treponema sp.]|nr:hypothetical protein [Treponema sp.]